jgi:hypothetical protein
VRRIPYGRNLGSLDRSRPSSLFKSVLSVTKEILVLRLLIPVLLPPTSSAAVNRTLVAVLLPLVPRFAIVLLRPFSVYTFSKDVISNGSYENVNAAVCC